MYQEMMDVYADLLAFTLASLIIVHAKQLPIITCYDIKLLFLLSTAYSQEVVGELWIEPLHHWPMQVIITSSQNHRTHPSDIRGFASLEYSPPLGV